MTKETSFAIAEVTAGKLNALVKNLMRQMKITDPNEAVRLINSGKWIVSPVVVWREEDGIIYFNVKSYGRSGPEWVNYFGKKNLESYIVDMLLSSEFKPTDGVATKVAILRDSLMGKNPTLKKVFAKGNRLKLLLPNPEVACLIREMFSNDEMDHGLKLKCIRVMHNPIRLGDKSNVFSVWSEGHDLTADCVEDKNGSAPGTGFTFALKNS